MHDRFVRAALHTVINGTHWKLVLGECAGWDTNSNRVPPPHWTPPVPPAPAVPGRCGVAPGCTGANNPMGKCPFVNGTWLFHLDQDPTEQCNLATSEPLILAAAMARLNAYVPTEVPVRYPDGSPSLDPQRCHPPLSYWFAADEPGLKERCTAAAAATAPAPAPAAVYGCAPRRVCWVQPIPALQQRNLYSH